MAGYIYCMKNNHWRYGECVKIGYTEYRPELRALQLSEKWFCKFEVLWELEVYEPAKAEAFLHEELHVFRRDFEFFKINSEIVRKKAEKFFDEHWREIEGKEVGPPTLVELVERDLSGGLLDCGGLI